MAVGARHSLLHGFGLFAESPIDEGALVLSEAAVLERNAELVDYDGRPKQPTFDNFFRSIKQLDTSSLTGILVLDTINMSSPCPGFGGSLAVLEAGLKKHLYAGSRTAQRLASTFNRYCFHFAGETSGNPSVYKLFHNFSFVNHSCDPNAEAHWDDKEKRLALRAVKPIAADEEITIAYKEPFNDRAQRWKALGFECRCHGCSATKAVFKRDDQRRRQLSSHLRTLRAFRARYTPSKYEHDAFEVTPDTERIFASDPGRTELRTAADAASQLRAIATDMELAHGSLGIAEEVLRIEALVLDMRDETRTDDSTRRAAFACADDMWHLMRFWGPEHPRTVQTGEVMERLRIEEDGRIALSAMLSAGEEALAEV